MSVSHTICFVIQYQIEQGIWIDKVSVPPLSINASGSGHGARVSINLKKKIIVGIDAWIVLFPYKEHFLLTRTTMNVFNFTL